LVVAVAAIEPLSQAEYEQEFTHYVTTFNKAYTADQFFYRFGVFRRALDLIREHNAAGKSWTMGINQFTDMTHEEFKAFVGQFPQPAASSLARPFRRDPNFVAPDSWDWISKGAVNTVKDQGQCGSCWAFSTVATVEGWWFVQQQKGLVRMAEQQLVDCSKDVCYGCQGGWPYKATEYVMKTGLCAEKDYAYTARDGQCKDTRCTPVVPAGAMTAYLNVSSEADILEAVASKGPVGILVEADRAAFQYYHSGILDDASCGTSIDHAITAVGYGTEGGKKYWNVKNSWGVGWGDKGYIRFVRDKNQCGMKDGATLPWNE